ncbi:hypothetical protein EYZ11_005525 [Aspergillus tanneri]|uniref:Transcription elongation factor Eaf N-terminal domain-containing protein n=1 Tax=Aspergillus tanneri TaxID=1220188 RepID=A0A4S3JI12_9EURO|nr:uncharacterized protein ATNIH1004_007538 [Aspergillus tanneri]KAA8646112.1 hypothetical protein ATNIH1004_007538 [Aspergillus tanneri]THC95013.1 hypothetical protein EYZ11_005525 [Aspergillus tanneri]
MAASALSSGLIDPTKQAEYPIILGDRLAGNNNISRSNLINIQYNYRAKSATAQQRSTITKSSRFSDRYRLTITDKAPNAEQSVLTYSYQGSVDPERASADSKQQNLVLVFDADRKAFVLEPVATQLNFNLRSAPAKTEKQVIEQHAQLRTLQEDDQGSGDDRGVESASGNDDDPADDSNPYDFRHFLPKHNTEDDKSTSDNATPEPHSSTSRANTPLSVPTATRPTPSPKQQPKSQANSLRQTKRPTAPMTSNPTTNAKAHPKPKPKPRATQKEKQEDETAVVGSTSDSGTVTINPPKPTPSPNSNIIIDGDLIIDMGSPPPSRPAFKVNPAHFSSNNTPANNDGDDDEEEIEDLRLPSPAGHGARAPSGGIQPVSAGPADEEEVEDDDALAAEMEAAFEESAREEAEARSQPSQAGPVSHQYHVPSEDESEVSEEE